eukprot:1298142-Alexandrium_andersonii.AAC.1
MAKYVAKEGPRAIKGGWEVKSACAVREQGCPCRPEVLRARTCCDVSGGARSALSALGDGYGPARECRRFSRVWAAKAHVLKPAVQLSRARGAICCAASPSGGSRTCA